MINIQLLTVLLRAAGTGLLLLALAHIPIARHLKWREEAASLSPVNEAIFHVHAIFIGIILVMMGLPSLVEPSVFIERSRAGAWMSWSFAGFWLIRLHFQWFVYPAHLWRGKRLETVLHVVFTLIWAALTAIFSLCGIQQAGWIGSLDG